MYYVLTARNVIEDAGGEWDQFALENGGDTAIRSKVIGTSIWDHIATAEVAAYFDAVLFSARKTDHVVSLPYRCDSPDEPRLFKMNVHPLGQGGLKVEHHAQPISFDISRSPVKLESLHSVEKCSICCAFKVGDQWIDPYSQPSKQEFPQGVGLCPSCEELKLDSSPNSFVGATIVRANFSRR